MRLLAITLIPTLFACGPIDPGPPTDEEGAVIETPGPYDDWLRVVDVSPEGGEVGPRPTIDVTFDTYLEDDELIDFAVMSIQSAGLSFRGRVTYQMTTRSLLFTPLSELEPGLTYRLVLNPEYLTSVTGAPFEPTELPQFEVVSATPEDDSDPPIDASWERVDEIFEQKCRSCHADPQWDLNPLTRESMVGERSEQVDRYVVVPFDPADSYLMHKILPDYPLRRFTVQPPPWSEAAPLAAGEVLLIETWIRNGAQ